MTPMGRHSLQGRLRWLIVLTAAAAAIATTFTLAISYRHEEREQSLKHARATASLTANAAGPALASDTLLAAFGLCTPVVNPSLTLFRHLP